MKEKKASANWYIAATHWLTAGFVVPFLMSLVIGVPLVMLLGEGESLLSMITFALLYIVSIWLGIMYSARYLNKTYVIKEAHKIVVLSTAYLALIGGGFRLFKLLQTGILSYELIGFVAGVTVFFIASKKYVKNNASSI